MLILVLYMLEQISQIIVSYSCCWLLTIDFFEAKDFAFVGKSFGKIKKKSLLIL